MKRLHSLVFGFTTIPYALIDSVNKRFPNFIEQPIGKTFHTIRRFVKKHFRKYTNRIASIYRASGFKFKHHPDYSKLKHTFFHIDKVPIQSFNYLLFYIIYFMDSDVFDTYKYFIKPQTKRLAKKKRFHVDLVSGGDSLRKIHPRDRVSQNI